MLLSNSVARAQGRASSQKEAAALKAAARPAAALSCAARRSRAVRTAAAQPVRAAAATLDAVRPSSVVTVDKSQQKPTVVITGECACLACADLYLFLLLHPGCPLPRLNGRA